MANIVDRPKDVKDRIEWVGDHSVVGLEGVVDLWMVATCWELTVAAAGP
ncbi:MULTISPECIES: hypothetical protein [Rhodococcus]|nr:MULTISPECIES: hypothetical protein [Rhodococcus]WAM12401.1 hypothetical protein OYT95_23435 [Rhodococcus sp. JS3073]